MSLAEFDEIDFTHSAPRLDRPSEYLMKKARRRPNGLQDIRDSYKSGTIYVGNLSFYTTEEQIYELFSKVGPITQIIMGLDRFNYTPCGFCFVLYKNPQDAVNAVKYLADTKLEDRLVQIDLDPGFREGRQFGRGASGGQVKDEFKFEYDSSRGAFGVNGSGIPPPNILAGSNIGGLNENVRFGARRNVNENFGDSYVPGEENKAEEEERIPTDEPQFNDENQE